MARRNVLNKSTLSLTAGNYLKLINAIDDLQEAEHDFYKSRANELSKYNGIGSVGTTEIEQAYDAQLGSKPWEYTSRFNSSNNDEADATTGEGYFGGTPSPFYVRLPDVDRLSADITTLFGDKYLLYVPGEGSIQIDVFYQNIDWFGSSGGGTATHNDVDFGWKHCFGEVPIKYKDNSTLTGWMAHMYQLVGGLYDSQVGGKWTTYESERNTYNGFVGGAGSHDFFSGLPSLDWNGYQGFDNLAYNRPDRLESKLVKETMGIND